VKDANNLEHFAVDAEKNDVFVLGGDLSSGEQVFTSSLSIWTRKDFFE